MCNILTLEIDMKWVKVVALFCLVIATNSCTVIGILSDTAIQAVSDSNNERRNGHRNRSEIEPFFTKKGLEQDVKLAKVLMAQLPDKKIKPVPEEVKKEPILACKNVLRGQQQCYPPEHYKEMYITYNPNKDKEAKLHK